MTSAPSLVTRLSGEDNSATAVFGNFNKFGITWLVLGLPVFHVCVYLGGPVACVWSGDPGAGGGEVAAELADLVDLDEH